MDGRYKSLSDPCFNFDISRTLQSIASIWFQAAKTKNITLQIVVDKALPASLFQDTLKLQYCLNNLVFNAIKHNQVNTVHILAYAGQGRSDKSSIVFSVVDNGPGISQERLPSLFVQKPVICNPNAVKFGRIDTGLPMTKKLIEDLGGRLDIKSKQGRGSVFSLIMPVDKMYDQQTLALQLDGKNETAQFSLKDVNLLVVDDYNLNLLTIKTLLQDHVSNIYTVANGFEALEVLNSCQIHVVLMDIHMPVLDGIETTIRIRESRQDWSNVFIVALTADPQYQHASLCKKIGMDAALSKPIRRSDMLRVRSTLPYSKLVHADHVLA